MVASGFYQSKARPAMISVLWGAISTGSVLAGLRLKNPGLRYLGIVLFFITMAKVFLFDMADYDTLFRILSFIGVGLLLIGASFLYHKYRNLLEG